MGFSKRLRRWRLAGASLGLLAIVAATIPLAGSTALQRRGGFRNAFRMPPPDWLYDGQFVFCRLAFRNSGDGDGGGWSVDYPRADLNFPFRLGELTSTPISEDVRGEPNHVVLTATDPHIFECPFLMMTEPGGAFFEEAEAVNLRAYLQKGGFLWVDDFWGEYAWRVWEREIRKVFPTTDIVDVPKDSLIFKAPYFVNRVPQISSINNWLATGTTSERYDSTVPHLRALYDTNGRIMVLMTHNTDIGDSWEREGEDRRYFDQFSTVGYAFGVNAFLYAMTH